MNLMPKPVAVLIWSALILSALPLPGAVVTANFTAATTVPVTAASYSASGNTVDISLSFAPPVGTNLTVVKNTGLAFIQGTFDNLAQGQQVNLTFLGIAYPFVANYYGGTGNDLVLQWANSRLMAWGGNFYGELGDNSMSYNSPVPVPVDMTGVLAGKTVIAVSAGSHYSLALCSDGELAAWGSAALGPPNSTNSPIPVLVKRTGVLMGKTVVAISTGNAHCLALCSDGSVGAWGANSYGQLGNNGLNSSVLSEPVLVDRTGVLADDSVIAVAAGNHHSLALCADGTVAAWGDNYYGQLGNDSTTSSAVPVLVYRSGVLAGRTVIAISAGGDSSFALCSDGTVAAWGSNWAGRLGNNQTVSSSIPVLVDRSTALAGRTVATIATGGSHTLVQCTTNTLAAWGYNGYGELGNSTVTSSATPVQVSAGVGLLYKTITAIYAGDRHSLAVCSDGTLAAWGSNGNGRLGNNGTIDRIYPISVTTTALRTGERFVAAAGGYDHSLGLVASPPPPMVTTLPASGITDTGVILNGSVNAQGAATTVSFEYGTTNSYGIKVTATPASVSGVTTSVPSAALSGLLSGTVYHYRIVAASGGGTVKGDDLTFTTTTLASLSNLTLTGGTLAPVFASINTTYISTVPFATSCISVTPVVGYVGATVKINGVAVASGTTSDPIIITVGNNAIKAVVTTDDGINTKTYSITVTRLPESFVFNSAAIAPVIVSDFMATGNAAQFALYFPPTPGTNLTVVKNTGPTPIHGTFANLEHGQLVQLPYGGVTYPFVANYFGGTGNDLVLQWANTRLVAWGSNFSGQLGNNSTTNSNVAVPVDRSGVLAGRTVMAVATGDTHNLALCSDGSVAAWGSNTYGELGNGRISNSYAPVLVDQTGVLAGKTVIAISAGDSHSFALCSDGTLAAWGNNGSGQLGNNSITSSNVPVLVDRTGVLSGRRIIGVAGGDFHSLALCSDGALAAWGFNYYGQLGINDTTNRLVPALVDRSGVLYGKTILDVAAGSSYSLVLCSDGTLAAWGDNGSGRLGNNSTTDSNVAILVNRTGVLSGRTVVAVATGDAYNLALCSDGTAISWGDNLNGQLGTNNRNDSYVPTLVIQTGVLAGKVVTTICAGNSHGLARCSDGTLVAWGANGGGQLGVGDTVQRLVPASVSTTGMKVGEHIMGEAGGAYHSLALVATPPPPVATTMAATVITDTGAILNGSVNAAGADTSVSFEYGMTTAYGTTVAAVPAVVSGTDTTAVSKAIGGLIIGTTYHYRVVAANPNGTTRGDDMTFIAGSNNANLTALGPSAGVMVPGFEKLTTSYIATVPFATDSVAVTPVTEHPGASVKVNGVPVASGTASAPISLPVGNTAITVRVTAEDTLTTKTYVITVTRLPESFVFNLATDVPVTANGFSTGGYPVNVILNYAPAPGTVLTMVNNTGLGFIHGTFSNLAQGQRIGLTFSGVTYDFVVNYYGGSGNDLVLQWAATQVAAWGSNSHWQLGDSTTTRRLLPTPVDGTGLLAGKTVVAVAEGYLHSLALCSDGTLAAWGYNVYGQLGDGSAVSSSLAVAVDRTGALAGKTVIAISAGPFHNLALCADGTVVAWGYNNYGQLGTGDTLTSRAPVLITPTGALAGKRVVAVAAGAYHSFALCADGSLAGWGFNDDGELGNGTTISSSIPVAVNTVGTLTGKQIASLAAGQYHTLALCTDGMLAGWGYNNHGQLGNNSTVSSSVPVAIGGFGTLAGKTPVTIRAGGTHSLALCTDGMLAAWGWNNYGQLGVTGIPQSTDPVAVDMGPLAAGTTLTRIAVGGNHSLALCANGTLAAWGQNSSGQLGNNSLTPSAVPVVVDLSGLPAGVRCMTLASGSAAQHNLAVFGLPSGATLPHAARLQSLAAISSGQDAAAALIARAFGLQPGSNDTGQLPQGKRVGDNYVIEFTQPAGVTGITYGAECSATLLPGSWTEVSDSGTGDRHVFSVPVTDGQFFMRLKVTGQ